jgi:hypothetical protein
MAKSKRSQLSASKASTSAKSSVKRRSRSVTGGQRPSEGVPGSSQDVKRRLGNFTSAGEHARVGGRTTGIVGQTTKRNNTDKKGQMGKANRLEK